MPSAKCQSRPCSTACFNGTSNTVAPRSGRRRTHQVRRRYAPTRDQDLFACLDLGQQFG